MFAFITYRVKGYTDPASQLFKVEQGQDGDAIAAAFTRQMQPVQVTVINVHLDYFTNQTMPIQTVSTLSLHALWRTCYRLQQSIAVYQKRTELIHLEIRGFAELPLDSNSTIDSRIENLQKALTEAIPLFKSKVAQQAFEENLLGEDVDDPNRTDF